MFPSHDLTLPPLLSIKYVKLLLFNVSLNIVLAMALATRNTFATLVSVHLMLAYNVPNISEEVNKLFNSLRSSKLVSILLMKELALLKVMVLVHLDLIAIDDSSRSMAT